MGRESPDGVYSRPDRKFLSQDSDGFCPFNNESPKGPLDLEPREDNCTLGPPKIVFKVVPDTAALTHSATRNDDGPGFYLVDLLRFLNGCRKMNSHPFGAPELEGVHGFRIKELGVGHIDLCGLIGKGAVHKDVEVPQPSCLGKFIKNIENILGTAHSKSREQHVAAPLERGFDGFNHLINALFHPFVKTVAVGRLNEHIIRFGDMLRIVDNRVFVLSHVTGKDNFFLPICTFVPDFEATRAKDMACIHKPVFQSASKAFHDPVCFPVKKRE
ncbi:MAG: hypothetical protein A4E63_01295 [Syntrophorhabdus sp. PtaU1.Bin050]|nr:MAG: hypothetical protein A4E63_01295 [Syntrophorhabdus sp. PtaU1.Bin050]